MVALSFCSSTCTVSIHQVESPQSRAEPNTPAPRKGKRDQGRRRDDLLDAVDWAVREGIAVPERVAIMGASYGGYAARNGEQLGRLREISGSMVGM